MRFRMILNSTVVNSIIQYITRFPAQQKGVNIDKEQGQEQVQRRKQWALKESDSFCAPCPLIQDPTSEEQKINLIKDIKEIRGNEGNK